ncbi:hypothetical protein AMTRI_Chr03g43870 [Amborella trichopoda]|nr:uncharacterized protein LOC18439696 [Amborella trichopoda]|eukprot:XP_011625405.1 uncharacterized protein LOC18439696 [Amborella trichopoda]
MQDTGISPVMDPSRHKQRKKKLTTQIASPFLLSDDTKMGPEMLPPPLKSQKVTKKTQVKEASPVLQQPTDRSNSDSLPDSSSGPGSEYRALRRKYLLLEEQSCSLGEELREVEEEVKNLEDEKLALLDQLVVLEGLIDPSELKSSRVF